MDKPPTEAEILLHNARTFVDQMQAMGRTPNEVFKALGTSIFVLAGATGPEGCDEIVTGLKRLIKRIRTLKVGVERLQ